MSVKVMGAVWDLKIDRDWKFVLLAYADHASHDGTSIYPAVSTIAEKTGYSERSVQTITRELEKSGYLIADGQGKHGTNRWRIPICRGEIVPMARGAVSAPVQESDDGGAENEPLGVQPTAPEPSFNHQLTVIDNKQIPEILVFADHFGHFNGEREKKRWVALYEAIGAVRAEEIATWAEKKEIHMMNRGGLLDSLETAAKKWTNPTPVFQKRQPTTVERIMQS